MVYYKSVSAIAGGGKTAVLLNTFSKGLARCSGSNWVFFPDPNWLCAPGANKNTIFIQNGNLKSELQYLMDQTEQAKETHRMEIVNDIYKKLHDLDYFLLRYGPKDVAKYVEDDSTVSKYYGTLPFYQ